MKKIKLLKGYHLTATERAHIRQLLDSGMEMGGTPRKHYTALGRDGNAWEIIIRTKMTDDFGNPKLDMQKVNIEYN